MCEYFIRSYVNNVPVNKPTHKNQHWFVSINRILPLTANMYDFFFNYENTGFVVNSRRSTTNLSNTCFIFSCKTLNLGNNLVPSEHKGIYVQWWWYCRASGFADTKHFRDMEWGYISGREINTLLSQSASAICRCFWYAWFLFFIKQFLCKPNCCSETRPKHVFQLAVVSETWIGWRTQPLEDANIPTHTY